MFKILEKDFFSSFLFSKILTNPCFASPSFNELTHFRQRLVLPYTNPILIKNSQISHSHHFLSKHILHSSSSHQILQHLSPPTQPKNPHPIVLQHITSSTSCPSVNILVVMMILKLKAHL